MKSKYHILTADERIKFLNDLISRAMEEENSKNSETFTTTLVTYRFYSRESYGHDTDEKVHAYMDRHQKQVPRYVLKELWQAYLEVKS